MNLIIIKLKFFIRWVLLFCLFWLLRLPRIFYLILWNIEIKKERKAEDEGKIDCYLKQWYLKETGIPLIAGTDTHALNEEHLHGRSILQKAKNIHFDNEDGWDLSFKTYDELIAAYEKQNALPLDVVKEAEKAVK